MGARTATDPYISWTSIFVQAGRQGRNAAESLWPTSDALSPGDEVFSTGVQVVMRRLITAVVPFHLLQQIQPRKGTMNVLL